MQTLLIDNQRINKGLETQLEKAKEDLKTKDDEIAEVVKTSKEEMKKKLDTYNQHNLDKINLLEESFDVCKKKGISNFFEST